MVHAGPLHRYHLHDKAVVTAEHHVLGAGHEGKPQNLLSNGEEHWNKWEVGHHERSWVEIDFHDKLDFKGIGFKSAGDHPRRCPTSVKIFEHKLMGWHELGHLQLDFGMHNWHTINFPHIHGDTKKMRFEFHNAHGTEGMHLGEIIFYHH